MIPKLATTLAVLVLPAAVAGQQPAPSPGQVGDVGEAPRMCFRGRPYPACRSFWIVEMQGETPVAQTTRTIFYPRPPYPYEATTFDGERLEWSVGHMVNLGPRYAAGGVVAFGTRNTSSLAVKLRGRRWLGDNVSVELEGGVLWTDMRYPRPSFGVTADARLNVRDQAALYVRWDGLSLPRTAHPATGYLDPGGFEQALFIGAGLGSMPALAGTAALGVAMMVVFVHWLTSENTS